MGHRDRSGTSNMPSQTGMVGYVKRVEAALRKLGFVVNPEEEIASIDGSSIEVAFYIPEQQQQQHQQQQERYVLLMIRLSTGKELLLRINADEIIESAERWEKE
jgi:hypothetical protein